MSTPHEPSPTTIPKTNPGAPSAGRTTLDEAELAKFAALAEQWWDPKGKFRPLHQIGPVRLQFVRDRLTEHFFAARGDSPAGSRPPRAEFAARGAPPAGDPGSVSGRPPRAKESPSQSALKPLAGLRILDIGCGGGLISEPLARMGARVTGIEPKEANLKAAIAHAAPQGLEIDYRAATVEELGARGETFDAVVCLEVVEHVPDVGQFVKSCAELVRPGGMIVLSTINRTLKSFALAIVGAEYVLRWLPVGTHQWDRFITPAELERHAIAAGLTMGRTEGMVYNPLSDRWSLSGDTDVNYLASGARLSA